MKIDWKKKLTSRKFWAAIIAVVLAVAVIFGVPDATAQQIVGLITAVSTLIAYIIGEGLVDEAAAKNNSESSEEK